MGGEQSGKRIKINDLDGIPVVGAQCVNGLLEIINEMRKAGNVT